MNAELQRRWELQGLKPCKIRPTNVAVETATHKADL